MKHLFYIHSALNYIISKQIIKHFALNEDDCVFLYDRIEPYTHETIRQYGFPHAPCPAHRSFLATPTFWKNWSRVQTFDKRITEITQNQSFMFYGLFSISNFFYLTTTHSLCKGYYFMEDGTASLNAMGHLDQQKPKSILRQVMYNLNFLGRGIPSVKAFYDISHGQFRGVLASCAYMFPNFPQKTIIGFPTQPQALNTDYEHVIVLDGAADFGLVSHESYNKVVDMLPPWFIKRGIKRVHVKYQKNDPNGRDSRPQMKAIFDKYNTQIEFVEIPPSGILEDIAVNSKANFYINASSIGFYVFLAQRKLFTWCSFLQDLEPNFVLTTQYPPAYIAYLTDMKTAL
jgi:hypothetical protein